VETANLLAVVRTRKAERCLSFSRACEGKGEDREPGSRKIFVRKFICDRVLPLALDTGGAGRVETANLLAVVRVSNLALDVTYISDILSK